MSTYMITLQYALVCSDITMVKYISSDITITTRTKIDITLVPSASSDITMLTRTNRDINVIS